MSRKWWIIGGGVILLALIGWKVTGKMAADRELAQTQASRKNAAASVTFAKVQAQDIVDSLELVASLESPFDVKLSPKTSGRITFLNVREGEAVKTGQVLVRLDSSELESAVLQDAASVAQARAKLAQAKLGQGGNDVSVTATIQQQGAAVASAAADLDQAKRSQEARAQAQDALVTDADSRLQAARAQERSARADLEGARANLNNAQSKLNRVLSLYKQGFIAAQDVDDAKTAAEVQKNLLSSAQEKLNAAQSAVKSAQAQLDSATKLATVNKRKDASDVAAAQARFTQAQASLKVAGANSSQKEAYQENISSLRSGVDVAKAQLRQSQVRKGDTSIVSTIDGVVTARNMDVGAVANAGQAILEVQFLKWLYAVISVPVDSGAGLKVGQTATLRVDGLPDQKFDAVVSLVNPAADPQSRQFQVRLKLDNASGVLRPGMFGRVSIPLKVVKAKATVPREALRDDSIFVVDEDGVLHERKVEVGATDGTSVEILKGVNPGETVVVLSYRALKDGQKVKLPKADGKK